MNIPTILIFALRHTLPRKTVGAGMVARAIREMWPELNQADRELIINDIKDALADNHVGDRITWERLIKELKAEGLK